MAVIICQEILHQPPKIYQIRFGDFYYFVRLGSDNIGKVPNNSTKGDL